MQRLTDRLAERLGNRLRLGTTVREIKTAGAGWRIAHDDGEVTVDGLVVATPADIAAALVAGFDGELGALLSGITYAPMRVIGVAFAAADVPDALDGFGFLAARGCGVRILGATYTSTIMPDQAPPGSAYLRVYLGGAGDTAAAALSPEGVRTLVLADIATVLGITAAPIAYHEVVWQQAIPQYTLRHRATVKKIEEKALTHRGFALTGNAYRGLGVGDTVTDASAVAARIGAMWKA